MRLKNFLSLSLLTAGILLTAQAGAVVILFEDFSGGIPGGWTTIDAEGNGVDWRTNADWAEENFTNGSGLGAMVCSDCFGLADHDASLISSAFSLSGLASAYLSYTTNYQNFASQDFFDVDISTDDGVVWTNLLSWNEDHGGFFSIPGEDVSIGLGAYLGLDDLLLRWRYYEPTTTTPAFNWYVQIDDVLIEGAGEVSEPRTLVLMSAGLFSLVLARRRWQSGFRMKSIKSLSKS